MADEQQRQQQQQLPRQSFDRLENFNFLLSRHDPGLAAKSRQFSFDADSTNMAPPLNGVSMDYDQTEGMGGLSVSSYDSIESERSSLDLRGYPYQTAADKTINYTLPDQMLSYSAHPIYPPIPYTTDEISHPQGALTPSDVSSSISPPNGQIGNNKYSTSISSDRIASALGQEEHVRYAAEEDRRRRNTAASARFRMKKKQREQTLEKSVRETTERNAALEARVAQLEMENRWLKNLLTEKHEATSSRATGSANDDNASNNSSGSNSTTNNDKSKKTTTGPNGNGQKHIQPKKKGVGTNA